MGRTLLHMLLAGMLAVALAACADDEPAEPADEADTAEEVEQDVADEPADAGEVASAGGQLEAWPDDAAELLPVPDVVDVSTASPDEDMPAFRGRAGGGDLDELAAMVDRLMDDLGWQVTDRTETDTWIDWNAEQDGWTADVYAQQLEESVMFEGGLARQ